MRASLVVIVTLLLAAPAGAGEEETRAPTKDLVAAAKEAKTKRKKPATKVLTNADVKKAKGTLIELKTPPGEPAPEEAAAPPESELEAHDEQRRARIELEGRIAAIETTVTRLQSQLDALEQRYYEENDPDRRDKLIRPRFEEKKKELDAARAELAALRPEPATPPPTTSPEEVPVVIQ